MQSDSEGMRQAGMGLRGQRGLNICACSQYHKGIEVLNGFVQLASIRAGEDLYKEPPFKFCPWCGGKLG